MTRALLSVSIMCFSRYDQWKKVSFLRTNTSWHLLFTAIHIKGATWGKPQVRGPQVFHRKVKLLKKTRLRWLFRRTLSQVWSSNVLKRTCFGSLKYSIIKYFSIICSFNGFFSILGSPEGPYGITYPNYHPAGGGMYPSLHAGKFLLKQFR